MSHVIRAFSLAVFLFWAATFSGCDNPQANSEEGVEASEVHPQTETSNRIAISPAVRSNLGITFVSAEPRRIEQTLRMPGRFEYLPTAHRSYRPMLTGRVSLLVDQFDHVEAGTPLFELESPEWFEFQEKLTEVAASIETLSARLSHHARRLIAHGRHAQRLRETVAIRRERATQLEEVADAGGGRRQELLAIRDEIADAEAQLAAVEEEEAELLAERSQTESALAAARGQRELLLSTAATYSGIPLENLEATSGGKPGWLSIEKITVRAVSAGLVERIRVTNGAWASPNDTVVVVVAPDRLRFHASALQSDLGVLASGQAARIVPPTPTSTGRSVPLDQTMEGPIYLAPAGEPDGRTLDVYVTPVNLLPWARSGVVGQLEVTTSSTASMVAAIPLAALHRDGLASVFFKRDPDNPNQVIRVEADLGSDDGRWVEVRSGLRPGDQVVLEGGFQLLLATSGAMQEGGHFHADGTFHDGEH
ncbi:MAG: efflux RND transporter periplasmic adaptor subunit [Phycisphaerales bacterium JB060]